MSDRNHNPAGLNDSIKVTDGPLRGTRAVIKHIFRQFLFCHAKDMITNSGMFVVRSKNVECRKSRPRSGKGRPVGLFGYQRPPTTFSRYQRGGRNNDILNKTVRIRKGIYKGHLGIVIDATETKYRVELHAKMKVVSLPVDYVRMLVYYFSLNILYVVPV